VALVTRTVVQPDNDFKNRQMTHVLNRLSFEYGCAGEEQALSFRQNFSVTFLGLLSETIDKVCSKYISENEWIKIDKIEVDLGRFTPYLINTKFTETFEPAFEKALVMKLKKPSLQDSAKYSSKLEAFIYFLSSGCIPWWVAVDDFDIDVIALELIRDSFVELAAALNTHKQQKNVWRRIMLQLNQPAKSGIVSLFTELESTVALVHNSPHQQLIQNITGRLFIQEEKQLIDFILVNAPAIFQGTLPKEMLIELFEKYVRAEIPGGALQVKSIIQEDITEKPKGSPGIFSNRLPQEMSVQKLLDCNNDSVADDTSKEEKFLVKNAGIVLLSPFFKSFFTNLKLLNGIEWQDKDAQYKAVHLLGFLSTGEFEIHEYNLLLEKMLCGLAIDEPLPLKMGLNEKEISEAGDLLQAVIAHWSALKNTSANGLQDSFLRRDGILRKKEDGWLLQVERKTLDVLLDNVPWGFSTIALAWNSEIIFVEW